MPSRAAQVLRDIHLRVPAPGDNICFYCDRPIYVRGNITKQMVREGRGHRPTDATDDHVFPQRDIGRHIPDALWWRELNKVPCCAECNAYKGHLKPLDWLVIMPSNIGADRLARRLDELGTPIVDITAAMRRRA